MAEMKCPLCSADMTFDDFTRAWVCPSCGKSIAEKTETPPEPETVPDPVPSTVSAEPIQPQPASVSETASVPESETVPAPVSEVKPVAVEADAPVPSPAPVPSSQPVPQTPSAPPTPPVPQAAAAQTARTPVSIPVSDNLGAAAIGQAYTAILNGQFEPAMKILSDLKKKRIQIARSTILSLFCGYRVISMEELLKKISGSALNLQKFAVRAEWKDLTRALPASRREYVSSILEYCVIAIELTGDAKKIIRNSQRQPSTRPSIFSKMDKEEIHNEQRVKSLERSRMIEQMSAEEIAADYEKLHPGRYPDYDSHLHESGSIVALAYDILDFLAADDTTSYPPTRKLPGDDPSEKPVASSRVINSQPSSSSLIDALQKLEELHLNQEDLISRQNTLLDTIRNLEQIILADPGRKINHES